MTAEEFLQRIYDLESDIACKEDEIRKIHEDMIHLKSVDTGKDRVDGGQPMDLSDKVANLLEVEAQLDAEWDELIKWREEARKLIAQLEPGLSKSVLLLRIVNHRNWKQIAVIVHKSADYCRHLFPLAVGDFGYLLSTRFPHFLETVQFKEYKAKNNTK